MTAQQGVTFSFAGGHEKMGKNAVFRKTLCNKKNSNRNFLGLLTLELSRIQLPECVYEKKVIRVQSWEIAEKWAC